MHDLKRLSLNLLKKFPIETSMTCIGILGQGALYLQAFKIFYLHSAEAVSLSAYLVALFSIVCWCVYGILKQVNPLIVSNAIGIIGAVGVIGGILCYR